ncbi:unnamed protein product, partial [Ixodes persulcatus]
MMKKQAEHTLSELSSDRKDGHDVLPFRSSRVCRRVRHHQGCGEAAQSEHFQTGTYSSHPRVGVSARLHYVQQ